MRRKSSLPALLCVLCGALATAGVAGAEDPSAEVQREFQAGVDAFRLGKLDEARAHLEKAQSLDPTLAGPPRFLAAVAQAQERWGDCITSARAALALNPRSTERDGTRKLHEACRASDGRPAFRGDLGDSAAIAVTANVPGASVKIGGLTHGGTPLAPRRIPPGAVAITVEKAGYKPARLEVDALPGIVTDAAVELAPADPPAPSRPTPKTPKTPKAPKAAPKSTPTTVLDAPF